MEGRLSADFGAWVGAFQEKLQDVEAGLAQANARAAAAEARAAAVEAAREQDAAALASSLTEAGGSDASGPAAARELLELLGKARADLVARDAEIAALKAAAETAAAAQAAEASTETALPRAARLKSTELLDAPQA